MRLSDARTHAVVDCIPVPPKITAKAPLYFKKGIDDAESEWSQHHAKRMIETGGKVQIYIFSVFFFFFFLHSLSLAIARRSTARR